MTGCLTRRAIFDVFEGDGSPEDRAHLLACGECRARLRELEVAVVTAASVIARDPPAQVVRRRPALRKIVVPLAAAIALAIGMAQWSSQHSGTSHGPVVVGPGVERTLTLRDVSKAITGDDKVEDRPSPDSDVAYLEAALGGTWPCEGVRVTREARCN
jgi:hypothetical protein